MEKKKNLIRFNVRNVKYALPDGNGGFLPFVSMGTSTKLALEVDSSTKDIYGDGRRIIHYVNEKGKTGTLTQNNICDEYEIAMGRKIKTAKGLADIKPTKSVSHVLYFEIEQMDGDNAISIAKTMLYGVTSSRPSEDYDQTTDDLNESSFELPLVIDGTPLLAADGKVYKDEKGNDARVWQLTATPDDPDYDTFGDEVILPTLGTDATAATPETPAE